MYFRKNAHSLGFKMAKHSIYNQNRCYSWSSELLKTPANEQVNTHRQRSYSRQGLFVFLNIAAALWMCNPHKQTHTHVHTYMERLAVQLDVFKKYRKAWKNYVGTTHAQARRHTNSLQPLTNPDWPIDLWERPPWRAFKLTHTYTSGSLGT